MVNYIISNIMIINMINMMMMIIIIIIIIIINSWTRQVLTRAQGVHTCTVRRSAGWRV